MKSVVVEASTVAKAIEIAWLKAEKPEEFFIRILQEHQVGFLGFGAQKAKIVLFFKNSQKSDSLFPVVLKQKEYASYFDNQNLKVPTELNVVDHELNKNVLSGQKKKSSHLQNNQASLKSAQGSDAKKIILKKEDTLPHTAKVHTQSKQNQQLSMSEKKVVDKQIKQVQQYNEPKSKVAAQLSNQKTEHTKGHHKPQPSQKKLAHVEKTVQSQDALFVKTHHEFKSLDDQKDNHEKSLEKKMQKAMQISQATNSSDKLIFEQETKDDVVKNVTHVLKKVKTQKIIATTSNAAAVKQQLSTLEKNVVQQEPGVTTVTAEVVKPVIQRFKRRPLNTDKSAPSGITKLDNASDKKDENIFVSLADDKIK